MADELAAQIGMLRSQAQANLYDFLQIDVTTCNLGLDMASLYAERHNIREVRREVNLVASGVRNIKRLIPSLDSLEQKRNVTAAVQEIEEKLQNLADTFTPKQSIGVSVQRNKSCRVLGVDFHPQVITDRYLARRIEVIRTDLTSRPGTRLRGAMRLKALVRDIYQKLNIGDADNDLVARSACLLLLADDSAKARNFNETVILLNQALQALSVH